MRVDREHLLPSDTLLVGFGGTKVFPVEIIPLLVNIRTYPQQLTKDVNFVVIDCSSTYSAIIDCPILNTWRAKTSIYHLLVKFPTEYGIGQVLGDQMAARECYIAMLRCGQSFTSLEHLGKKGYCRTDRGFRRNLLG